MLKLYNKEHEAIGVLTELKDYKIEYVLSGEDSLEFSLSRYDENIPLIEEECYIRTKHNEYVIKAIEPSDNFKRFTCNINIENLVGKVIKNFDTKNNNITDTIRLAISGTGWILADNDITKRRTVTLKNTNALEVLREVRKVFSVDFRYDAINKKIYVYEKFGEDKGVYFSDELNLKSLSIPSDTYDYVTRLYPYGKDGLTISEINNGKEYIENFQYSNKIIELIWQDNRYTDVNSLKEDAEAKLEVLSKPNRSYQASVTDLTKQSKEYSYLDFFLGDTVTLLSKSEKFRDKQRIVKYIEYPDNPSENTCELGNTILTFEELQQENEYKNQTVDNITTGNGIINGEAIDGISTEQIYDFEAEVAKITDLTVINADITNLKAENVTITGKLNAVEGEFGTLKANVANIDKLVVNHTAEINNLIANKADITDLTATNIKFDVASGGTLDLQTLLSKFVTGENGQFINISSSNSVIANATIKNAMIESLSVDKLLAGRISTNKFTVSSDDGGIEIVGATQQFKDKNNKVRIQMGQDTQGNFNFILRGEDGTTTLIDHTGIKEKAIADDLIKENMVAADAIGEKQINYSSLITGLNKDTNTQLIKASKVAIDLTGQSLEVAFNSLKSNVDGLEIGGRNLQRYTDFTKDSDVNTWSVWRSTSTVSKERNSSENSIKVVSITSESMSLGVYQKNTSGIGFEAGEIYTVKALVKGIGVTSLSYCYFMSNDSKIPNSHVGVSPTIIDGEWSYVQFTCIPTSDYPNGQLLIGTTVTTQGSGFEFKYLKVEKGNKATDWTPAPEDIDSKIEANTTAITVAQGKIEGIISETSIIKGDVTTISDKYTSLKATVDGINSTVASHTSSIGTINANISGLSGKVTTVENNYTSLSQDLSGFKTAVGNNYSTKSELSTVDGKVNSLTSRVGTAESSITQLNKEIDLKVGNVETLAITNFNNLLVNSNIKNSTAGWRLTNLVEGESLNRSITSAKIPNRNTIMIGDLKNLTVQTRYMDSTKFEVSEGEQISISLHGMKTAYVDYLRVYMLYTDNTSPIETDNSFLSGYQWIELDANSWKKYTLTTTVPSGATRGFIRIRYASKEKPTATDNNRVALASIMVNRGETYPTWTSNTEDNYSYQETRLQAAEQKITPDAITNTVKQSFYTKSETESTIISKGYQTSSQVQQTVDKLELKFTSSGGMNLLRNSSFQNSTNNWKPWTNTDTMKRYTYNNNYALRIIKQTTSESATLGAYYYGNDIDIVEGKYYSISYKMRSFYSVNAVDMTYNYWIHSDGNIAFANEPEYAISYESVSGGYYKVKITFKSSATRTGCGLLIGARNIQTTENSTGFGITEVMVQEGKICTEWTPHPSELYDGITAIDKDGIIVTHTGTGNYSKMSSEGFLRYVNNSKKTYHYLMTTGTANVEEGRTATITLPSEFKGKNFKVTVSAFKVNIVSGWTSIYDIDSFVSSIDTTNGKFTITGMVKDTKGLHGSLDISYIAIA